MVQSMTGYMSTESRQMCIAKKWVNSKSNIKNKIILSFKVWQDTKVQSHIITENWKARRFKIDLIYFGKDVPNNFLNLKW